MLSDYCIYIYEAILILTNISYCTSGIGYRGIDCNNTSTRVICERIINEATIGQSQHGPVGDTFRENDFNDPMDKPAQGSQHSPPSLNIVDSSNVLHFFGLDVPFSDQFSCRKDPLGFRLSRCMCDPECMIYKDCCADAFESFINADKLNAELRSADAWYREIHTLSIQTMFLPLIYRFSNCIELATNETKRYYKIIDKCPEIIPDEQKKRCSQIERGVSSIPVSLNYRTHWQIVFRNIFCALCHGLREKDIVSWKYFAECPNNVNISGKNEFLDKCVDKFEPPDLNAGHVRTCIDDTILQRCSDIFEEGIPSEQKLACDAYIAPVQVNGGSAYRNIHCATCHIHAHSKTTIIKPLSDVANHDIENTGGASLERPQGVPSLMIVMFSFDLQDGLSYASGKSEARGFLDKYHCDNGLMFDYTTNACRQIICPTGKILNGTMCERDSEMTYIAEFVRFPESKSYKDNYTIITFILDIIDRNVSALVINETLTEVIIQAFPEQDVGDVEFSIDLAEVNFGNGSEIDTPVNRTSQSEPCLPEYRPYPGFSQRNHAQIHRKPAHAIFEINSNIDAMSIMTGIGVLQMLVSGNSFKAFSVKNVNISNMNKHAKYKCNGSKNTIMFNQLETVIANGTAYAVDKRRKLMIDLRVSRFELTQMVCSDGDPQINVLRICSYLQCPMVEITMDEFHLQNNKLVLNYSGEVIDDFEIQNSSAYICANISHPVVFQNPLNLEFLLNPAFAIISYTTTSLSIVALLCTIFIYIKSASVRSIHGKTLVSLSVTLIVAQTSLLLKTKDVFCIVAAIVAHLSWLSAFAWMNVISYDMMRTFIGRRNTPRSADSVLRYFVYSCICLGVPSVIVLVCIVLNFTLKAGAILSVDYGKNGLCFIGDPLSAMVFFTVPFLSSVLFNVIAFGLTVYGISSKRKKNPSTRKSKDRLFCLIYLKLSIAMGVTWVFAILAESTNLEIFWYLHVSVNGLQGVFLFISFALRARIWRSIKFGNKRICCKSNEMLDINTISTFNS